MRSGGESARNALFQNANAPDAKRRGERRYGRESSRAAQSLERSKARVFEQIQRMNAASSTIQSGQESLSRTGDHQQTIFGSLAKANSLLDALGTREDRERLALSIAFWFLVAVASYIIWTRLGYVLGGHAILQYSWWAGRGAASVAWYPVGAVLGGLGQQSALSPKQEVPSENREIASTVAAGMGDPSGGMVDQGLDSKASSEGATAELDVHGNALWTDGGDSSIIDSALESDAAQEVYKSKRLESGGRSISAAQQEQLGDGHGTSVEGGSGSQRSHAMGNRTSRKSHLLEQGGKREASTSQSKQQVGSIASAEPAGRGVMAGRQQKEGRQKEAFLGTSELTEVPATESIEPPSQQDTDVPVSDKQVPTEHLPQQSEQSSSTAPESVIQGELRVGAGPPPDVPHPKREQAVLGAGPPPDVPHPKREQAVLGAGAANTAEESDSEGAQVRDREAK